MGVAEDVGGDDALIVVAVVIGVGEGSLEGFVDLVGGGLGVQNGGQLGDGAVRNLDALGVALQLAVHGRNDLADGLGSAGGVGDGVDGGGAQVAAGLGATRAIEQHLGAGVGVDGGHEAGLDAELLVQQLDHGGHGVGGAGTGGDDHVGSLEDVVVHAEHNGRGGVILGRGGDQDLLGASVDVSLGLLGGGVEAGALEHVLNTVVLDPRNVVGVLLGVDLVFLAVDDDGVFGGLDVNRSAIVMTEGAVGAVVLQQVSQGSRGGQIVDGGNFNVTSLAAASLQLEDATEGETTNATEAVDTNLNCHVILPCRVALARFGTPGHCLPTVATVMPTLYTWQRFSVRFG